MPELRLVMDLLLFRRGPQDMPGSTSMLYGSALAYFILEVVQGWLAATPGIALLRAIFIVGAMVAYVSFLLRMRGFPNRTRQTLIALFASGAALTIPMLALTPTITDYWNQLVQVSASAGDSGATGNMMPQPPLLAMLGSAVVGVWAIAVSAHIYRHALQCARVLGLVAVLGFDLLLFFVFSAVSF